MKRLQDWIGRLLCLSALVCIMAGCAQDSAKTLTVRRVDAGENGECDCWCYGKTQGGEPCGMWVDCPCSTKPMDTLQFTFR